MEEQCEITISSAIAVLLRNAMQDYLVNVADADNSDECDAFASLMVGFDECDRIVITVKD
jgi:hypothetical protein